MEFTTQLELHSQTTRLLESLPLDSFLDNLTGLAPSMTLHPSKLDPEFEPGTTSRDYNSDTKSIRLQSWALPSSLAVTRGILVSFFSSAY